MSDYLDKARLVNLNRSVDVCKETSFKTSESCSRKTWKSCTFDMQLMRL